MSGGKSSSNTTTTTQQDIKNETNQAEASGVVSGDVLQGQIEYYNEFGPDVLEAFKSLIDLTSDTIQTAERTGAYALESVATRRSEEEQPGLSSVNALMPVLIIGSIGAAIYFMRKK